MVCCIERSEVVENMQPKRALARCLIAGFHVMACLPLRVARAVGMVIGVTAWWLKIRPARITSLNIDACFPRLTRRQRRALCRRSLIETGRVIAETGFVWYGKAVAQERCIRVVEGPELIEGPVAGGTIVIMPHFGNWEALAYAYRGSRLTGLYAPPRVPGLEEEMIRARGRWGAAMVRADIAGLRAVKRTLENGHMVAILPDQTPRPEAGVPAPFFGREALTMTLVHRLLTEQTRVVVGTALRTQTGFEVRFRLVDDRIRDPDPLVSTAVMNAAIESEVLREPAQYQWEYNRFRFPLR